MEDPPQYHYLVSALKSECFLGVPNGLPYRNHPGSPRWVSRGAGRAPEETFVMVEGLDVEWLVVVALGAA